MYIKEESSTSDKEFVTTETQVCGGSWDKTTANRLLQDKIMTSPTSLMQIFPSRYSIITRLQPNMFFMLPIIKPPKAASSTTDAAVVKTHNPETQISESPKQALDKSTLKCNNVQMCSNIILPPPSPAQSLTTSTPTTSIIPTSNNGIVGKQPPEQLNVLPQINNTNTSCNLAVLPKITVPNKVVDILPLVTVSNPNINSIQGKDPPISNDKNVAKILPCNGRTSPPPLVEISRDNKNTVAAEKPKMNLFKQNNIDVPPLVKISNKTRPDIKLISIRHCFGPFDSAFAAIDPPFYKKPVYNVSLRNMAVPNMKIFGCYVKHLMPNSANPVYVCRTCNYTMECEESIKKHAWFHTNTFKCITCLNYFNDAYQYSLHIQADTDRCFDCPVCGFFAKTKNILSSHINHIHLLRKDCIFCGIIITSSKQLAIHEEIHRLDEARGLCEICGCIFKDLRGLSLHHGIHMGEKQFTCTQCNKKFTSIGRLSYHKYSHKTERPYPCNMCHKNFRTSRDLRLHHARCHEGMKNYYDCPNCNTRFKFKSSMNKHYKKCQHLETYRCSYCEQRFMNPYKCTVHMQSHSNDLFECPLCDHKDKSKTNVLQHLVDVHSSASRQLCKYCGQNFTDTSLHAEHEESHTGRRDFKCIVCNKKFALSTRLHGHQILAHTVTIDGSEYKRKRFMCEVCGKSFEMKFALREHYHVHTAKKSISCRFCDKLFCSKQRVKLHEKLHGQEKTNVCTYCGKWFLLLSSLRLHLMSHTGELPHICHGCGKGFRRKNALKVHLGCCKTFKKN